jgi:GNAT superfamily N-acetyltransferase
VSARGDAYERMLRSMREHVRLVGRSSEGAHVVELDGVLGAVVPKVPERSYPNSVLYESQAALASGLPELARHYDEAGVRAWTVWAPEDDTDAARALAAAGHVLDADPAAMTMELSGLPEPRDDLDYRTGDDLTPIVASINDRAYPWGGTPFSDYTSQHPHGVTHDYVAYVDGEPVAAVAILPVDADASVWDVATLPEARGRGLAGRLLHRALWDARERGCDMSSLQATKLGEPVYARLGYRRHGALQMWERRRG